MSSAFEDYEEILGALDMLMQHPPLGANDEEAKIAAAELIRELRKIIALSSGRQFRVPLPI